MTTELCNVLLLILFGFMFCVHNLLTEWAPTAAAIDTYSRTFAQAVAGIPSKMHYDSASRRFELCYAADPAITQPTVIYV